MKKRIKPLIVIFLPFLLLTALLIPLSLQTKNVKAETQAEQLASIKLENTNNFSLDVIAAAPSYQIGEKIIQGQTFDTVSVPGATTNATPGEVELPLISALVGVPPEAHISLEILEEDTQNLTERYQIALAPYPAALTDESNPTPEWDYNLAEQLPATDELSSNNAAFSAVQIADEGWLRDQRLIRLEYTPFRYNASNGNLAWHPYVKVRLHFEYPEGYAPNAEVNNEGTTTDSAFESFFKGALLNYEQATQWRAWPETNPLVTPPEVGSRYRIAIDEDGIYKLTYEALYAADPTIAGVDSSLLHMTSQGDEIAIEVSDANGSFGPGDYVLFYGQRFYGDRLADLYQNENALWANFTQQMTDGSYQLWKPQFNEIMLEKYTFENVYWLYISTDAGLRMTTVDGDPSGNSDAPVSYFRETIHAEESNEWKTTLFTGEDTWFWTKMTSANHTYEYTTTLTGLAPSTTDTIIRGEFVSEYYNTDVADDHHTEVSFNGTLIDDNYWSGKSRYHFEVITDTISLNEGTNTLGLVIRNDAQVVYPRIFFDWFEIEYNRLFQATNNTIYFNNATTGLQKYQVDNFSDTSEAAVLDISDPLVPVRVLNAQAGSGQVTISLSNTEPLIIAMDGNPQDVPAEQVSYYTPPDWAAMATGADYVYITHADFITATQALADYRANQSGLSTQVINVQDLYNEFNFGIFNPIAIKNFLTYTFDQWQNIPTYALLIGDGHWNFHGYQPDYYIPTGQYIPPNLAWVDPWQGEVDSANLLATIAGDDPLADLFIARLPVNSSTEIEAYRQKLVSYEAPHDPEAWEQNHVFVADNADSAGNFRTNAEDIINQFITPNPRINAIRIYQDDYGCTNISHPTLPGSTYNECVEVRNAITNTVNITGSLIVNYIGHASVSRWSHELISTNNQTEIKRTGEPSVFIPNTIENWATSGRYPVILSMDCLDGYWSGPGGYPGTSIIEELVRQNNTGAIAAFSPTGLGVSTGHGILHEGFYDSLMNAHNWEMGAATMNAKLQLYMAGIYPDLLHTYTIFGDPALEIRHSYGLYLPITIK